MCVLELGKFSHDCEGALVCESLIDKVPYFNAPIFTESKSQIGKIEEVFGRVNSVVSFC